MNLCALGNRGLYSETLTLLMLINTGIPSKSTILKLSENIYFSGVYVKCPTVNYYKAAPTNDGHLGYTGIFKLPVFWMIQTKNESWSKIVSLVHFKWKNQEFAYLGVCLH